MNEFARIPEMTQSSPLSRDQLMTEQNNDPELCRIADEHLVLKKYQMWVHVIMILMVSL